MLYYPLPGGKASIFEKGRCGVELTTRRYSEAIWLIVLLESWILYSI